MGRTHTRSEDSVALLDRNFRAAEFNSEGEKQKQTKRCTYKEKKKHAMSFFNRLSGARVMIAKVGVPHVTRFNSHVCFITAI